MNNGRRRALAAAVLSGVVLLAGACGGGSHPATANTGSNQLTARSVDVYAQCIRSHGMPGFYFHRTAPASTANPTLNLGGWMAPDPGSAQFQAAMKACQRLFPGGSPQPITQSQRDAMLKFAACIRAHGYPGYPDPQFGSGGGVIRPQPTGIDMNSSQFQAATTTCNAQS